MGNWLGLAWVIIISCTYSRCLLVPHLMFSYVIVFHHSILRTLSCLFLHAVLPGSGRLFLYYAHNAVFYRTYRRYLAWGYFPSLQTRFFLGQLVLSIN
jgi:hypothetical protein